VLSKICVQYHILNQNSLLKKSNIFDITAFPGSFLTTNKKNSITEAFVFVEKITINCAVILLN
jgi:hypothetical protein